MKKKLFTSLGLMSGTSMDGVDLSLIKTDGDTEFSPVLDDYFEFDVKLQEKLINLRNLIFTSKDLEKYSIKLIEAEREFTLFNAKIINKIIGEYNEKVDLIGFHGQTIFHNPNKKITKQLGDGKLLSQVTKKIVVNNFREKDLKNGGQGAPLTPIFHKLISQNLLKKNKLSFPLNIINIGGITNITQIEKNFNSFEKGLIAFDIAPGNCLIDEWVRNNSKLYFDKNGELAKSGQTHQYILNQAIENFEIKNYSNSLDTKDFDISFVRGLSLEDGCATITTFTAKLISDAIKYLNKKNFTNKFLLCGGGRKNNFLIKSIKENLKNEKINIDKIDNYGLNGDYIESQAFGYLAIRSLLNLPISFKNTTGCDYPTIGGRIVKNF